MSKKKRRNRARAKPGARPRASSKSQAPDQPAAVRLVSYEVTDEPILDREYKRLPEEVKDAVERLHHQAQAHPSDAIPELIDWIERYPNVVQFSNFLVVAYTLSGQKEKADAQTEENYRRHLDYLFARVQYGEMCLERGELDRIPEIFDGKYDLKMLYPNRNKFHVTEVTAFMGLMGAYFVAVGKRDVAQRYHDGLVQLDPEGPATRRLGALLLRDRLRRLVQVFKKTR